MKSIEKTNYKFAAAPVALLPITNGNEFKIITYLSSIAYVTDNSTVSVSYSQLMKDCNITCNNTIKRAIDNLIKLGLISRVSGNGNNSNAYTINFDYINELDSKQTLEIPIEKAILYSLLLKKLETIK